MLLTGCAKAVSDAPFIAAPDLPVYSQEFQTRLADEIEAEEMPVCPRDFPILECSAWLRAVLDYGRMRDQIRSVTE